MKRILSSFLATAVFFGSVGVSYGAVPEDVADTPYEEIVAKLMAKDVLSGYESDGSFQPERTINRAEACIVVVRAMGAQDEELELAVDSDFTDMTGFRWASKYINYAAEYGIVSGYGNDTFKPGAEVTIAEMVVMLIRACGIEDHEIDGLWPTGYMNKARELGMLEQLQPENEVTADMEATRGNVALMAGAVVQRIEDAHVIKLAERPEEEQTEYQPLSKQEAKAYLAVIAEVQEQFGAGAVLYSGQSDRYYSLSGLFGVYLIDFDGDGKDELLLAYGNGRNLDTYRYDAYRLEGGKAVQWLKQEAAPQYDDRGYTYLVKKSNGAVHLKIDSRDEQYVTLAAGERIVAFNANGAKGEVPRLNDEVVSEDVLQDAVKGYFESSKAVYLATRDSGKVSSYTNDYIRTQIDADGFEALALSEDTILYLEAVADGKSREKGAGLDVFNL